MEIITSNIALTISTITVSPEEVVLVKLKDYGRDISVDEYKNIKRALNNTFPSDTKTLIYREDQLEIFKCLAKELGTLGQRKRKARDTGKNTRSTRTNKKNQKKQTQDRMFC